MLGDDKAPWWSVPADFLRNRRRRWGQREGSFKNGEV